MKISMLSKRVRDYFIFSFGLFIFIWSGLSLSGHDEDENDDYGNYFYNATNISKDGTVRGVVNSEKDYDSFKVKLEKSGTLNISLSKGLIGWFYRTKNYDDLQRLNYPEDSFDLQAGTYYIILSGQQKPYEMILSYGSNAVESKYELTFNQSYGGYVNLSEGNCIDAVCTVKGNTDKVSLQLTAHVTDDNYIFSHWTGIPECNTNSICHIEVSGNMNIGVEFVPKNAVESKYELTFNLSYSGYVNLKLFKDEINSKGEINCIDAVCTVKGNTDKISLRLTAQITDNNYTFSYWTGIPECNTDSICYIEVSGDMNIGVEFIPININPANTDIINGIPIPPEPDKTKNNASIKGVDSNNDGIRDDVERVVAENFGSNNEKYIKARNYASAEQLLVSNPEKNTIHYLKMLDCIMASKVLTTKEINSLSYKTFNTKSRMLIYKNALVDASDIEGVSNEYCE